MCFSILGLDGLCLCDLLLPDTQSEHGTVAIEV